MGARGRRAVLGTFQYDGIDPHMVEAYKSRGGPCPAGSPDGCDPIHGREWDTTTSKAGLDLQYACTFDLPVAKNCADPNVEPACDCGRNPKGGYVESPVCAPNPQDGNNPTLQRKGKAYPTIRELRVAKELGPQAVVGSVCPRTLDKTSPDYGYRPVVRNLAARINALREGIAASR